MADYYLLNRAVGAPPVVGRVRKPEPNYNFGRWILAVIIVAVLSAAALAAYWWFQQREAEAVTQLEAGELVPFVSFSEQDIADATTTEPATLLIEQADLGDTEVADDEIIVASVVPVIVNNDSSSTSPSNAPRASLTLSFSGDCWTEVSDASGKLLYNNLAHAGRNISVSGDAPLHVLFGDSANVRVAVNGQEYVITDAMRSGRMARLTVNAP